MIEKKKVNTKSSSNHKTQRKLSQNEKKLIGLKNGLKGLLDKDMIENEIEEKLTSLRKSGINLESVNKHIVENNRIVRKVLNTLGKF